MADDGFDVVTGAFGYTGRYLTRRLLDQGRRVVTITGHPDRPNPFDEPVEVHPFDFDRPERLEETLQGAETLYNTYWVRFPYDGRTFAQAVENSRTLVQAAALAGARRTVHVSIANPSDDSPLAYYRGKAEVEACIRDSGLSYAFVRPTVIFGREDILINNIAWLLRHMPVFLVAGDGQYRVQPVYVDDLAALLVEQGQREDDVVVDAVGPEVYTFDELVRAVARAIDRPARLIHVSPGMALGAVTVFGWFVRDKILTQGELHGLMSNLLVSSGEPTTDTRFSQWAAEHADELGQRYTSELARHYR